MNIKGIIWLGVRTKKFKEQCDFYEKLFNLPVVYDEPGFKVFDLPNGDRVEVFDEANPDGEHFSTGPVVGFWVDNIEAARAEMEAAGITFLGETGIGDTSKWAHFRGPDGNTYEITERNS